MILGGTKVPDGGITTAILAGVLEEIIYLTVTEAQSGHSSARPGRNYMVLRNDSEPTRLLAETFQVCCFWPVVVSKSRSGLPPYLLDLARPMGQTYGLGSLSVSGPCLRVAGTRPCLRLSCQGTHVPPATIGPDCCRRPGWDHQWIRHWQGHVTVITARLRTGSAGPAPCLGHVPTVTALMGPTASPPRGTESTQITKCQKSKEAQLARCQGMPVAPCRAARRGDVIPARLSF
jgi:hypothetical protein